MKKIKTGIIVTDITDHFPAVFYKKNEYVQAKIQYCKQVMCISEINSNHSDDNVARFKKSLSRVNWSEILDGVRVNWSEILDGIDANSGYDNFIKKFTEVYDECIPLKKIQNQ